MATINVVGDTIKVGKAFVSGKDRIDVNGNIVFEGKMAGQSPVKISAGKREYTVESKAVSSMTGVKVIHLQITENHEVIHVGVYDQNGRPVQGEAQAKSAGAIQICAMIGGPVGVATMMALNAATGVVPGGAIGGAIGGGVGAAIGFGVGSLLFGRKP